LQSSIPGSCRLKFPIIAEKILLQNLKNVKS